MAEQATAVVVDDDVLIAMSLELACEMVGVKVIGVAHSAEVADRLLSEMAPDFVLMDVRLGSGRDGIDVAISARKRLPDTRFIYVTGANEQATLDRINLDHPHKILIKPITDHDLRAAFA